MNKDTSLKLGILFTILLFCSACATTPAPVDSLNRHKVEYSIVKSIISRHHPRIIYFYSDSPDCKDFGLEVTNTAALYGNFFDSQYVDVKEPSNRSLTTEMHITAPPAIFIFDNVGNEVFTQSSHIDHATLSKILKALYLEEYKEYETEKSQKSQTIKKNESVETKTSSKTNTHTHH